MALLRFDRPSTLELAPAHPEALPSTRTVVLRSKLVPRSASAAIRRKVSLPAAWRDALSELYPPAGSVPVSRSLLSWGSRDVRSNRASRAPFRGLIPGAESDEVLEGPPVALLGFASRVLSSTALAHGFDTGF